MPKLFRSGLTFAMALIALPGSAREVDESYTVDQRFAQYRDIYPGIAWPAVTWREGQSVLFDRPYKTLAARTLHLDIFGPATANGQGIVLVHGGAWRSGAKTHFYALANLLAQRGYTVFLPEFRLSVEAPYPAGMEDVADALAWAKSHAGEFGISADRIALGGASSGGQMAALLAYAGPGGLYGETRKTRPNALIDLDGVLDMADPEALRFENAAGPDSPFARLLGGSFEAMPQRWREASAASHVGPQSPPTLIVGSGIARFTVGKDRVIAALDRNHVAHREFAFAGAPHDFWLFDPWLSRTAGEIDTFLRPLAAAGSPK
ncbi:alpha/beta hydrolase fold domain-containing protein [Novosphingobium aerophilum]|uniref:alpha/beta hydrolase n=1 Tax=Novosphingobium TaxID=165696 RepID=UPI0012C3320F|nr:MULTISPECIES: alpha/beta hydrolase [unclassified Novosphingobium]MPS70130.1 alpha/beta hydrolase [Novosphingobium sp.]WRT95834.1 alpha/beta hydrolase [Novosphingobium sp. RL4]